MPQSRVALAESLSDTLASLQTARSGLSNAWALRMSASQKAHFAAVMGNSLTRNCREQGWIVEDALRADVSLVDAMHGALCCAEEVTKPIGKAWKQGYR